MGSIIEVYMYTVDKQAYWDYRRQRHEQCGFMSKWGPIEDWIINKILPGR